MAFYKVTKKQEGGGTTKDVSYLKWQILKTRSTPSGNTLQMAEFYIYQNGEKYTWDSNVSITSNLAGNTGEDISKLIDGNINTKYCTGQWGSSQTNVCNIVISLGETITLDSHSTYSFCTPNDETSRDPISWKLFGSTDGTNWELLDERNDATVPTNRYTETISFPMSEVKGESDSLQFKNYAKFDGADLKLPFKVSSDYKITLVYYQTEYRRDEHIIGETESSAYIHFTTYSDKYYVGIGTGGEANFGSWSSGEHTFICNNGNNHNEFDGTEVTSYTPNSRESYLTIGSRAGSANCYSYIKSYTIESISTGNKLFELKPVLYDGQVPCLYDSVGKKFYYVSGLTVMDTIPTT